MRGDPITPERYFSEDYTARKWDKIQARTWQIAGLDREVQNRGDNITTAPDPERILCTRGDDSKIQAFYNVCQHCGLQLMTASSGNIRRFVCPYHGWAYGLKGTLKAVPDEADYPQGSPCGIRSLVEIPCESWAGFV